jgi:ComF family protein
LTLGGDPVETTRCLACQRVTPAPGPLCGPCHAGLGFDQRARCYSCARPLRQALAGGVAFCRECQFGAPFARVVGIGLHRPPLSDLIHRFKFAGEYALAPVLANLLARAIDDALGADGLTAPPWSHLVPVPMHPQRLRQRGYNQAALLARALSRHLAVPVDEHWLARRREVGTQVHRSGVARRRELAGSFALAAPGWWRRLRRLDKPPWLGQAVLLVDDVFTTGSTVRACTDVLLAAGAARVDVAVLAISTRSTP